jgi:hypothetical protein
MHIKRGEEPVPPLPPPYSCSPSSWLPLLDGLCLDHIGEDPSLFDGLPPYLYLVIYMGRASTAASPVWSIVSMYTGGRETTSRTLQRTPEPS